MPWLPVLHSREDTITYFTDHVLLHEEVLVAEANHPWWASSPSYVITSIIHISPQRISIRGSGIKLLAIAKELHPHGLTLWTFQENARARRFYEARGFLASEFTDGLHNKEGQ